MYPGDDDRIQVRLLPFGCEVVTEIWLSRSAEVKLTDFVSSNDGRIFAKKLKEFAKGGFANFEGGPGHPIKHERDGVFRIGIKRSLFRLLGFYGEGGFKREFIAIEAIFKKGQGGNSRDARRIRDVARVKASGSWQKVHA